MLAAIELRRAALGDRHEEVRGLARKLSSWVETWGRPDLADGIRELVFQ